MPRRRAGRPNAREAELKHEAMLEAALEEFARHGFQGASVRAIAQRGGVSTRTLYNRYPDKVALFEACLEMSALRHQLILDEGDGTLREQLLQYARHMQGRLNNDRQVRLARVIFRECTSFPQMEAVSRRQYERFQLHPVQKILMAHGFAAAQAQELASFFAAMLFHKWQNRVIYDDQPMTPAQVRANAETVTDLFLNGACSLNVTPSRSA